MPTHHIYGFTVVFGALLLLLLAPVTRNAEADTDVTVNDTRDLPDPSPLFGGCSSTANTCTLRAAIQRANHRLTGTHTIRLPAGTFHLDHVGRNEDFAETGDLDIRGNIVIIGTGAKSTTINGLTNDRVFDVHTGSLVLQDLSIIGGSTLNGEDGGGIRAKAPLTLDRVFLHSNTANGNGGGIWTNDDLSVVRSTISNNRSVITGGGIRADFVSSQRTRDVSIRESTISGNTAGTGQTGGVEISLSYDAAILHSTIAFNDPGGVRVEADPHSLTINHTILANNIRGANCVLLVAATETFAVNVDSDASCGFSSNKGNLALVDPQFSALTDNGGQTPTHLFNNLQLADAGDTFGPTCSGIDQRGFPRPVDIPNVGGFGLARCDIGAIELQGPVGIAVLDPETATVSKENPFNLSYLWRVPLGQNWHDLKTLDLRVVDRDKDDDADHHSEVIFWVRWTEATNTFQLVDPKAGRPHGPAFPAGSNHVLETEDVLLDLRNSSVQGSGPTGQEVTLHLALTFDKKSKKDEPFAIEVTAVDDSGRTQQFLAVGSVAVEPPKTH